MSDHRTTGPVCALARLALGRAASRALVNAAYLRLSARRHRRLHHRFCKLLWRGGVLAPGTWRASFAGLEIRAPLRAEHAWLDWELALSFTGHDVDVKRTYVRLLSSPRRPEVFVDVGANYGTHSILFLRHGVETLPFEPNPECHEYFRALCALNDVPCDLQPWALGDGERRVTIRYPERATWLGAIDAARPSPAGPTPAGPTPAGPGAPPGEEVVALQTTLDRYLERLRGKRVLIKIDTEGHELSVLRGAAAVLRESEATIVFETWTGAAQRREVFEAFRGLGYGIEELGDGPHPALAADEFAISRSNDFLARRAFA